MEFSKFVQPIKLSDSVAPINLGKGAITAGYGLVNLILNGIPENLQYAKFKITETRKCGPIAEKARRFGVICGNVIQGRLCHGDRGNPLVSPETGRLVGIAIPSTWHDCEINRPQNFIGISAYYKWIEATIFVHSQTRLDY